MIVLDVGCGPGVYSIEMARLVSKNGKVIAADLQAGMLNKLKAKIAGKDIETRIVLHKCQKRKIGVSDRVDFILAFYMVHEVPDKQYFFKELSGILKNNGRMLIIEPKFHVSGQAFREMINIANDNGLKSAKAPKVFYSRTVILEH